jgi:hypothetical protein
MRLVTRRLCGQPWTGRAFEIPIRFGIAILVFINGLLPAAKADERSHLCAKELLSDAQPAVWR